MKQVEVVCIEDKKEYREVLKLIVNGSRGFYCEHCYVNGAAALAGIRHQQPDVVLADLGLPDMSGVEVIRQLKQEFPAIQFVVVSVSDDEELVFEALTAGAEGYMTKDTAHSKIIDGIRELLDGGAPMSAGIAKKVLGFFSGSSDEIAESYKNLLTKREIEVLEKLKLGLSYRAIAEKMFVSPETIKSHCHNIYTKLHVSSKDALIAKVYSDNPMVFKLKEEVKNLKAKISELEKKLQGV